MITGRRLSARLQPSWIYIVDGQHRLTTLRDIERSKKTQPFEYQPSRQKNCLLPFGSGFAPRPDSRYQGKVAHLFPGEGEHYE